jgi:uncharacterized membrane protein
MKSTRPGGQWIAIAAESLYLANLLILPGIGFLLLLALAFWGREGRAPLAAAHLEQTVRASLWAGLLLIIVVLAVMAIAGAGAMYVWTLVILYFIVCHAALVLLGAFGLTKALAGHCWRYPLVGPPLPGGCPQARRHV